MPMRHGLRTNLKLRNEVAFLSSIFNVTPPPRVIECVGDDRDRLLAVDQSTQGFEGMKKYRQISL